MQDKLVLEPNCTFRRKGNSIASLGMEERLLVHSARNFVNMMSEIHRKFVDK